MENKFDIGEPVCVYGWISSIEDADGKLVYGVVVKDNDGQTASISGVAEELITTVF